MSNVVLDASALLAMLNEEQGADGVASFIPKTIFLKLRSFVYLTTDFRRLSIVYFSFTQDLAL